MQEQLRKVLISSGVAVIGMTSGFNHAAEVEAVIGLDVDNSRAFISAMDNMFESGAMDGYTLTIWANAFDGANPATHTLVASFDDYQAYDRLTRQRLGHTGWLEFQQAVEGASTATSSLMAVELYRAGEIADSHRSGVAFVMTVSDPAKYAAEFSKLTDAQGHPGSIRLMQLRYGSMGATHAVVLGAPNSAVMNEYLDDLLSSEDYADFAEEVADIRKINTVNNYDVGHEFTSRWHQGRGRTHVAWCRIRLLEPPPVRS